MILFFQEFQNGLIDKLGLGFLEMYTLHYSRQAKKDLAKIKVSPYLAKFISLVKLIQENPYTEPPLFEPLVGSKKFSRRINLQHRLVSSVNEDEKSITILSCWTHYHD